MQSETNHGERDGIMCVCFGSQPVKLGMSHLARLTFDSRPLQGRLIGRELGLSKNTVVEIIKRNRAPSAES
jgi:hypothetical protein